MKFSKFKVLETASKKKLQGGTGETTSTSTKTKTGDVKDGCW
jgi:hypothetical protein